MVKWPKGLSKERVLPQAPFSDPCWVQSKIHHFPCLLSQDKTDSVAAATTFLEQQLSALRRPYDIAITTYALTLANSIRADEALTKLKGIATYDSASNTRYWRADDSSFGAGPKPYLYSYKPKAFDVETTSYALLTLLELDDLPYSHAIVNWLTNQENYQGGFVSTQDTVIALQALAEYSIKSGINNVDISCEVSCQEALFDEEFLLKPSNAIIRQSAKIPVPKERAKFRVWIGSSGTGMGQLKFESSYNIPEPNSEICDFVLNTNQEVIDVNENIRHIRYNIEVRYLTGEATGMAIVDVGLYTGYKPIIEDLDQVKRNSRENIPLIEETDQSVVFYLDEIREDRVEVITFRAERKSMVGQLQPVAVKVYDYYNPTIECNKFIHPDEGGAQLNKLCEGDTCVCAAAFKVEVVSEKDRGIFLYYHMNILAPIKQGQDFVKSGVKRFFLKSTSCDQPKLGKETNYLVIGNGAFETTDDTGQESFKYIIDERMSFYEWPIKSNKTITTEAMRLNKKLERLQRQLTKNKGCDT